MIYIIILFSTIIIVSIINHIIYYNINNNYNLLLINYYIIMLMLILSIIYTYFKTHIIQKYYNGNITHTSEITQDTIQNPIQNLPQCIPQNITQDTEEIQNDDNNQSLIRIKCECKPIIKICGTDIYAIFMKDTNSLSIINDIILTIDENNDNKIVFVLVYDQLGIPRIILTQIKDIKYNNVINVYRLNDALIDVICNVAYIDNYNVNNILGRFNKNGLFVTFHNELKKFIKHTKDVVVLVAQ